MNYLRSDYRYIEFALKKYYYYLISALFLIIGLSACEKDPGQGGTSSIEGIAGIQEVSSSGNILAEYPAIEERIYIIYGDNEIYDDEVRTSFDGRFKFTELFKGTYTIFAYSDCSSCPAGTEAIMQTVTINDNDEVVSLPSELQLIKN